MSLVIICWFRWLLQQFGTGMIAGGKARAPAPFPALQGETGACSGLCWSLEGGGLASLQ